MPTSTTRATLRQNIIKRAYRGKYPIVSTATSNGTSTTIVDTALQMGAVDQDYARVWVYIASKPSTGPAIGEVTRATIQSTSTLTVSPALSASTESAMSYELHYDIPPKTLHDMIDDVLTDLEYSVILPLSLVSGGDMEGTIASDFDDDGRGTGTIAANTTTVRHGTQSLKLDSTAADDYATHITPVAVTPGERLLVATDVYLDEGDTTATLTLYDEDGAAVIDSATTEADGSWSHLQFECTVPDGCYNVSVRLGVPTITQTAYFDNCILQRVGDVEMAVPSELEWHFDVRDVFTYDKGRAHQTSASVDSYHLTDVAPRFFSHWKVERDEGAVVPYRIILDEPISSPVWVRVDVDFPAFAGASEALKDADTTVAPPDVVEALVVAQIWDWKADKLEEKGELERAEALRKRAYFVRMREAEPYLRMWRRARGVVKGTLR